MGTPIEDTELAYDEKVAFWRALLEDPIEDELDAEIMAMSDEEIRKELADNGIDADAAAARFKAWLSEINACINKERSGDQPAT